jgi:hypothetical protein
MDQILLREFRQFAIARWPPFPFPERRAFHLADSNHLSRMRLGQFAAAGKPATPSNLGQIFAHVFLRLGHTTPNDGSHRRALQLIR